MKKEGKLMQIGTKLGKNTTFLQIIYYVARTTLKWHKFLGLPSGSLKWTLIINSKKNQKHGSNP
jgi:hypothetical protein